MKKFRLLHSVKFRESWAIKMNDLIEKLSKVDLDLVEKVIHHLNDDDLEGRDS